MQRRRTGAIAAIVIAAAALTAVLVLTTATKPKAAAGQTHRLAPAPEHGFRGVGGSTPQTLPFAPNLADRATRPGEIPSLYGDGLPCSVGCRPYGAELGWPLRPFHQQHALRAGLNELRPGSLHVGVDIQARDGQDVYAVQPGIARVLERYGPNGRVQVGNYIYWHINPMIRNGDVVTPFKTVIGTVMAGYGHIALSEINGAGDRKSVV